MPKPWWRSCVRLCKMWSREAVSDQKLAKTIIFWLTVER
jgi:hypothetical protein